MGGFSTQKESETKKLKEWIVLGRGNFLQGRQGVFRKFQIDWFKIPFLGKVETVIKLVIKFWFGLAKIPPFWPNIPLSALHRAPMWYLLGPNT